MEKAFKNPQRKHSKVTHQHIVKFENTEKTDKQGSSLTEILSDSALTLRK